MWPVFVLLFMSDEEKLILSLWNARFIRQRSNWIKDSMGVGQQIQKFNMWNKKQIIQWRCVGPLMSQSLSNNLGVRVFFLHACLLKTDCKIWSTQLFIASSKSAHWCYLRSFEKLGCTSGAFLLFQKPQADSSDGLSFLFIYFAAPLWPRNTEEDADQIFQRKELHCFLSYLLPQRALQTVHLLGERR